MRPNGVAQTRAQLFDELRLVLTAQLVHGHRPRPRVALELEAAAFRPHEQMTAGSFRVSRKIEYGAGIELNARNASSASRSISPRGSARSSDANSSEPLVSR